MAYVFHILILICIYAILAQSLNLLAGYTGMLSIAHASFYGVGAYVCALLTLHFHVSFWVTLIIAAGASSLLGLLLAWPALRVHDDFFVLVTFAFQIIVFSTMNNLTDVTGGPMGLSAIPSPTVFGHALTSPTAFLAVAALGVLLCCAVVSVMVVLPTGRVLRAVREDEVWAQALGKNVVAYKLVVFALSAGMAAMAGGIYAGYVGYIDPTSFTLMESIFILSILIVGGAGTIKGPLVGAVVLVAVPEALRFLGLPSNVAANVRQIVYGSLLVVMMLWRPAGIAGQYAFASRGRPRI